MGCLVGMMNQQVISVSVPHHGAMFSRIFSSNRFQNMHYNCPVCRVGCSVHLRDLFTCGASHVSEPGTRVPHTFWNGTALVTAIMNIRVRYITKIYRRTERYDDQFHHTYFISATPLEGSGVETVVPGQVQRVEEQIHSDVMQGGGLPPLIRAVHDRERDVHPVAVDPPTEVSGNQDNVSRVIAYREMYDFPIGPVRRLHPVLEVDSVGGEDLSVDHTNSIPEDIDALWEREFDSENDSESDLDVPVVNQADETVPAPPVDVPYELFEQPIGPQVYPDNVPIFPTVFDDSFGPQERIGYEEPLNIPNQLVGNLNNPNRSLRHDESPHNNFIESHHILVNPVAPRVLLTRDGAPDISNRLYVPNMRIVKIYTNMTTRNWFMAILYFFGRLLWYGFNYVVEACFTVPNHWRMARPNSHYNTYYRHPTSDLITGPTYKINFMSTPSVLEGMFTHFFTYELDMNIVEWILSTMVAYKHTEDTQRFILQRIYKQYPELDLEYAIRISQYSYQLILVTRKIEEYSSVKNTSPLSIVPDRVF